MNIHFGNQSQFELFPGTTGDPIENSAPRFIFSRIVLTFENVVVVFVFVIVSLIIAFSIGVEHGRVNIRLARPVAQVTAATPVLTSVMSHPKIFVAAVTTPVRKPAAPLSGAAEAAREVFSSPPPLASVLAQPAPAQKGIDKGYTVQVASYKKESLAEKEASDLKHQGLESSVAHKGNYWIVCVGRYPHPDLANQMLNKLKKRYKDSMIRSF